MESIERIYAIVEQYPTVDFLKIYKIQHKGSHRTFILYISTTSSIQENIRKFEIMSKLRDRLHKNIISIVKQQNSEEEIFLITEFAPNGNLLQEIQERKRRNAAYSDSEIKNLADQLISACLHLQRLNIAHFNIRLDLILKTINNTYKLSNFFFACKPKDFTDENFSDIINEICSFNGMQENLYSPEVLKMLNGQNSTVNIFKSDVYLLGLVLLSAACLDNLVGLRKLPVDKKYEKIKGMIQSLNCNWLKSLLSDMLEVNNVSRPDFEILYMKYLDHSPKRKYVYENFRLNPRMTVKFIPSKSDNSLEKRIVKSFNRSEIQAFSKELHFYKTLERCPYVLQIFYSDEASMTLHLEFYEHSLQDFIDEEKYFNVIFEDISKKFIFRLISAFAYIENQGLVHGCIKPGHIMVNKKLVPKIVDFSTMVLYEPGQIYDITGDENFKATELIGKRNSSGVDLFKAEVFSLGLLIFQLFAGYSIEGFNRPSKRDMLDQCLASFPIPTIKNLLVDMLDPDPNNRPYFSNIIPKSRGSKT